MAAVALRPEIAAMAKGSATAQGTIYVTYRSTGSRSVGLQGGVLWLKIGGRPIARVWQGCLAKLPRERESERQRGQGGLFSSLLSGSGSLSLSLEANPSKQLCV